MDRRRTAAPEMGFQVHRFCLSWWLLLVALTCLSQGRSIPEKRSAVVPYEHTFEDADQKIRYTDGAGISATFNGRVARSSPQTKTSVRTSVRTTITTTADIQPLLNEIWIWPDQPTSTTTTTEESILYKQFINLPLRCPDGFYRVSQECRELLK